MTAPTADRTPNGAIVSIVPPAVPPAAGRRTARRGLHFVATFGKMAAIALVMAAAPALAQGAPNSDGVYAESGFRLPLPRCEQLNAEGQAIFGRMTAAAQDPRRGAAGAGPGLKGPSGIMLYSPKYFDITNNLNLYLRFESGLDGYVRELAILVVAREADNAFEWAAHQASARSAGVEDNVIEAVRCRAKTDGLGERAALIIALGRETITDHRLSRTTYDQSLRTFGAKSLVDLTGLMGNYLSTALVLTAFAIQTPQGPANTLPPAGKSCPR